MIEFVLWSFVVALTPVVLGLTYRLILEVGDRIDARVARDFEGREEWDPVFRVGVDHPSASFSNTGRAWPPA